MGFIEEPCKMILGTIHLRRRHFLGVGMSKKLPTGGGRGQKLAKLADLLNGWFLIALNYEIFETNHWKKTGYNIRARVDLPL